MNLKPKLILPGLFLAVLVGRVNATIIPSSVWNMGEAGSVSGSFAQDAVNADGAYNHFTNGSGLSYLTDTPAPGSSAYMHTAGASVYEGTWMFTGATAQSLPSDNWGVEFWARSTANDTLTGTGAYRVTLAMGSSASGQLSIEQRRDLDGNIYWDVNRMDLANLIIPRDATTLVNQDIWYDLAIVKASSVLSFYVNGNLAGTAPDTTVNDGLVHLGIQPTTGGHNFVGDYDELRVFTFAPGAFQKTDLYNFSAVPEPSSFLLLTVGAITLGTTTRKSRSAPMVAE